MRNCELSQAWMVSYQHTVVFTQVAAEIANGHSWQAGLLRRLFCMWCPRFFPANVENKCCISWYARLYDDTLAIQKARGEKHKNVWTIWLSVVGCCRFDTTFFWGRKWKSFGPETVKEARSSLVSEKHPFPTIWILPRKLTAGTWTKRPLGKGKKKSPNRWFNWNML